jgi:putative Mn2+ efflux pump MntP
VSSFILLFLIAIGLSMDAVAVLMAIAISSNKSHYCYTALWFGSFQTLMPILGWLLGKTFLKYIVNIDHWIAFILLSIIGLKMIIEATKSTIETTKIYNLNINTLFMLSLATSIDAFAVGLTISFLHLPLLTSAIIIGLTTFLLSSIGAILANKFKKYLGKSAEFIGGFILIIIAIKILLEHLKS